jgi:hypothetical protein
MRYFVFVLAVVVGCGDESKPAKCSKEDRHGVYKVATTYNNGNCGDLGTFSVQLDNGEEANDCIVHRDEWSKDECTLTRSLTCTTFVTGGPNGAVTYTLNWNQTSTQEDSEGNFFSGPVSLSASGNDGTSCSGTYHFTYTRLSE